MEHWKIERINELAHKAKSVGLTQAETMERDILRREYVKAVLGNVEQQLDQVYLVDENGNEEKLKRRKS